MPKSTYVINRNWGDTFYCPYCDYKLKNKKGVILHMKASHGVDGKEGTRVKDIKICFCGKRNCENYKIHTPGR